MIKFVHPNQIACFKESIATDKRGYPHNIFLISPQKTYVVGTH